MSLFRRREESESATLIGKRMGPLYESTDDREFFTAAALGGKVFHETDTCLVFRRDCIPSWGNRDDILLFLYAPSIFYADLTVGTHGTVTYAGSRLRSFTAEEP
ncbi:MAG: hypothetical protein LKJ86_10025 [Oscillibacter sp.]|jgi:hypothetical protein|nr:hypothetical protein [Oscillibacter sp.]